MQTNVATYDALVDRRIVQGERPATASRWNTLRPALTRRLARYRLARSIAHLDDRLLADVGLGPQHLGQGERLMRRYAAGGDFWTGGKADTAG